MFLREKCVRRGILARRFPQSCRLSKGAQFHTRTINVKSAGATRQKHFLLISTRIPKACTQ